MQEKMGDFLMRIGAMKKAQVDEVLKLQKAGDTRLFGVIAVELGYIKEEIVKSFLDSRKK
jgi:hypothetical protein